VIHPTAVIDPRADLAPDVSVGPYSIIGPQVSLGAGAEVGAHVVHAKYTGLIRCGFGETPFLDRAVKQAPVLRACPFELAGGRIHEGHFVAAGKRGLQSDLRTHGPCTDDQHALQFMHAREHEAI